MKKLLAVLLTLSLLTGVLTGCGGTAPEQTPSVSQTPQPSSPTETEEPLTPSQEETPVREMIHTNGGEEIFLPDLPYYTDSADASTVYYLSDISANAMVEIYNALQWSPTGNVAVKLSTGEPPASNYLRPELIADLVQLVDGTIVECNTAYGGSRASTAMHYQVAEDHGFTAIAPVQIQDENGSMALPVEGGTVLSENYVGAAFADYESYLVLSHFKGHSMAGFGGAIKNISIGLGSSEGKAWIHSGGTSRTSAWGGDQDVFLEAMGDAGKSVSDYLGNGERIVYINVMNRLSVDCDCDGNPAEPDMHDIGILASSLPLNSPKSYDMMARVVTKTEAGSASFPQSPGKFPQPSPHAPRKNAPPGGRGTPLERRGGTCVRSILPFPHAPGRRPPGAALPRLCGPLRGGRRGGLLR